MKNPNLKCRYAKGLGDLIACVLHSKVFGWAVHIITGKKEPCQACSQRINALNVLFPIPFWKFYFKNVKDVISSLSLDLIKAGHTVEISDDGYTLNSFKQEDVDNDLNKKKNDIKSTAGKKLISTNNLQLDGYLIKTEIYKS
jgi:hypothetical protein